MRMSRLQMETGQIWELMVIRQRHPNPLPVEVRIRQIHPTRNRDVNIPVRKCGTKKRQPVQQQAIREILTVRSVIKNFPQERSIAAKGHSTTTKTQKATASKDGKITTTCTRCGTTTKTVKIAKVSKIKLSKTKYTYNGKKQTPSVTVKDSKGKELKVNTDYKVKLPSGRKNVGTYEVKITFKGSKYSGSKTLSYTINPKSTKLSKVSAKKKGFEAKWEKQSTQTKGYQIQYSTDSKFKSGNKTVTVNKNSTTKKTISKLKAKKKYYVRIRTYKTVGKQKYYSDWSKSVKVTTKK